MLKALFIAATASAIVLKLLALAVNAAVAPSASISTLSSLWSIVALGSLAMLTAALSHFLFAAQGPGMIFRPWRIWAFRNLWFAGRSRKVGPFGFGYYRTKPTWRQSLYKITGGCIYCSSVWVGSFFYCLGAAVLAAPLLFAALCWPLFVGAQFVWIELFFVFANNDEEKNHYPGPALKEARARIADLKVPGGAYRASQAQA